MRRPSLTIRLVAGVVLAQLLLAAGLVWLGVVLSQRQLREAFDIDLRGRLMSIAALVRYPEQGGSLVFESGLVPPERDRHHPVFYEVRRSGGEVIASTFPAGIALPTPGPASTR